jgi:hypothetical protein
MSGNEGGVAGEIESRLRREYADHGERHRHQRGLCILGQGQFVLRPLEDRRAQLLAEGLVDLGENRPGRREGIGERLAHAHRLTALPGKYERDRHVLTVCLNVGNRGGKTLRSPGCQAGRGIR